MNRIQQILLEAINEAEKYGSLLSMYFLIKKLASDYNFLSREEEKKYDVTVDDIVLLALSRGEVGKIPFFSISFLICDYLSSIYSVQDCVFYFRWNKRIFVYSPRVEAHLYYLIRTGYVIGMKFFKLTEKGKHEADLKMSTFTEKEKKDIVCLIDAIKHKKRIKEIKDYVKEILFKNRSQ